MNQSAIYSLGCLAKVGRVEVSVSIDRETDGSWLVQFDVFVWDDDQEERKVPTTDLQLLVLSALGIETELAGNKVYPSLVGRLAERPDPTEFTAKIEAMLATADLETFWREPEPAAWWGDRDCFLDPDLPGQA